jgi:hypothetical protein
MNPEIINRKNPARRSAIALGCLPSGRRVLQGCHFAFGQAKPNRTMDGGFLRMSNWKQTGWEQTGSNPP